MRDAVQEKVVRDMINAERMARRLSQKKLAKYSGLKLDEVKNFDNFQYPLNLRLFHGFSRGLGIQVKVIIPKEVKPCLLVK